MTELGIKEPQQTNNSNLSIISRFNLNGPAVVAASAGTGKTYTITGLVVRLLLGDGIPRPLLIEEIMLMTFTNAATRDMKRKVREKIEYVYDCFLALPNEPDNNSFEYELLNKNNAEWKQENNRQLALKILKNAMCSMDKANISTIHSFCGGLLKKYAMDSMYDMGATLVNDDSEIKQEAIYKVIQKYMYELSSDEIELLDMITGHKWTKYNRTEIGNLTKYLAPNYTDCKKEFDESKDLPRSISELLSAVRIDFHNLKQTEAYNFMQKLINNREDYFNVLNTSSSYVFGLKLKNSINDVSDIIYLLIKDADIITKSLKSKPKKEYENLVFELNTITDTVKQFFESELLGIDLNQVVTHIILKESAEIYKDLKNSKRIITNDDLLLNLRDALSSDSEINSEQAEFISKEVRKQYPVAIIDEFQDTDPVQFDIVSQLYIKYFTNIKDNNKKYLSDALKDEFCGFYIIGDKKQSIYRFRGADVSCYINAVDKIAELYTDEDEKNSHVFTLDKNFRSTTRFVEATNKLFGEDILNKIETTDEKKRKLTKEELEDIIKSFSFEEVKANGLKKEFVNVVNDGSNVSSAPVQIVCIENEIDSDKKEEYIARLCANQIVRDLETGYFVKNDSKEQQREKIKPSNIAILVHKAAEYEIIEKALKQVGLTSVFCSDRRNIKQTEEFKAILNLMKAVDNSQDRNNIRKLLVSSFFTRDIEQYEHNLKDTEYEKLINVLSDCKEKWLRNKFFDMYVHFINNLKITTKDNREISIQENLLCQQEGITKLTNLQHAAEIAQKYSSNLSNQTNLIPLFENLINNNMLDDDESDTDDSMKLRLSGDANTIKVYTYHSSKGLEYDIVYMPFIGKHTTPSEKNFVIRDVMQNDKKLLDYTKSDESSKYEYKESTAEFLRLWYVAATRPKYRMYLWFYDKLRSQDKSSIHKMLYGNEALDPEYFNVNYVSFDPALAFEKYIPTEINYDSYGAKEFDGVIDNDWHITSYSGITKNLSHLNVKFEPESLKLDESQADENDQSSDNSNLSNVEYCFEFPKGATAGDFLHKILEEIDFVKASENQEENLIPKVKELLEVSHLNSKIKNDENVEKISKWILNVINTPLKKDDNNTPKLSLSTLGNDVCLKEMEFLMTLGSNTDSSEFIKRLFEISKDLGLRTDKDNDKNNEKRDIGSLKGLLTGFIDLFFMYDNKFYVADYKSNMLGNNFAYYTSENIKTSMVASNYDIQFLIYSVAAFRYLHHIYGGKTVDPKTEAKSVFKEHFGGIYYLYLRGMKGNTKKGNTKNGNSCDYGVFNLENSDKYIDYIAELNDMLGDNNNDK